MSARFRPLTILNGKRDNDVGNEDTRRNDLLTATGLLSFI